MDGVIMPLKTVFFCDATDGLVDGVIMPLKTVFCDATDGLVDGVIVISLDGSITLFRKARLLRHPLYYSCHTDNQPLLFIYLIYFSGVDGEGVNHMFGRWGCDI